MRSTKSLAQALLSFADFDNILGTRYRSAHVRDLEIILKTFLDTLPVVCATAADATLMKLTPLFRPEFFHEKSDEKLKSDMIQELRLKLQEYMEKLKSDEIDENKQKKIENLRKTITHEIEVLKNIDCETEKKKSLNLESICNTYTEIMEKNHDCEQVLKNPCGAAATVIRKLNNLRNSLPTRKESDAKRTRYSEMKRLYEALESEELDVVTQVKKHHNCSLFGDGKTL